MERTRSNMYPIKIINSCLWTKKKVIIMNIKKTINDIKQNANLNVIGKFKNK